MMSGDLTTTINRWKLYCSCRDAMQIFEKTVFCIEQQVNIYEAEKSI